MIQRTVRVTQSCQHNRLRIFVAGLGQTLVQADTVGFSLVIESFPIKHITYRRVIFINHCGLSVVGHHALPLGLPGSSILIELKLPDLIWCYGFDRIRMPRFRKLNLAIVLQKYQPIHDFVTATLIQLDRWLILRQSLERRHINLSFAVQVQRRADQSFADTSSPELSNYTCATIPRHLPCSVRADTIQQTTREFAIIVSYQRVFSGHSLLIHASKIAV